MTQETAGISLAEAKAEAVAGFRESGRAHLNCAQSVVFFAMRALGRDPGLITAARYMGGGMVRLGHECGAVSGAVLALGLRDFTNPAGTERDVAALTTTLQELVRDFETEFGHTTCRELTGHDLTTKEGYKVFAASEARTRCADYVGWVCDRVGAII